VTTPRYALLIPVKNGQSAKTRLGVGGDQQRARLMTAFARDAISAAAACPLVDVHVIGDAAGLTDLLAGLEVTVVPDEGAGDLNRALARAEASSRTLLAPVRPCSSPLLGRLWIRTSGSDRPGLTGPAALNRSGSI
jgi:2-phospho-L-lactate guanylyltransferase (CobY/MobA/RfbA family)